MAIIEHANPMTPAAEMFHALADPNRLAILKYLSASEARVADLVEEMGLAQSTVSAHVGCLRASALIEGRAEGRQTFYRIKEPALVELLASAEALLGEIGHPIHLCVEHGVAESAR
jgi:ArsR family transcriptional regulator, cadmium/lead-responsive transcriptional repressor